MIKKKSQDQDLTDSPADQDKLKPDEGLFDFPEIKDVPGAGRSGKHATEMPGDTTISSADEEGDDIFEDKDILNETDVSPLEKKLLNESFDPSYDEELPIGSLSLDERDNEGELLQETALSRDLFGKDLDDELIEEEDEETEGESQQ